MYCLVFHISGIIIPYGIVFCLGFILFIDVDLMLMVFSTVLHLSPYLFVMLYLNLAFIKIALLSSCGNNKHTHHLL